MKTYIWKKQIGSFISFDEEIDAEYWAGQIGTTYQDYLDGKWVLLSEEKVTFHEEHPRASVKEVWDMQLTPVPPRTLEEAKREKIELIDEYDSSSSVDEFIYNNVPMWLDKATRDGLYLRLLSEQAAGKTTTTLWFGTMSFSIGLSDAFQLLYAIEVYASECYDCTASHKAAVEALSTIEDVDAYDYTTSYPEKLVFNS